jgi:hypothetical protein
MPERVRIAGYAIVSVGGMIADQHGHMPAGLKIDADLRSSVRGSTERLWSSTAGNSHERQPGSCRRRDLILTRRVPTIARHPRYQGGALESGGIVLLRGVQGVCDHHRNGGSDGR